MNNFTQRTLTGTVFVIALVGSILLSPVSFALLFLTITILSLLEFFRLVTNDEVRPQLITGIIVSVSLFSYFTYISQSFYRLGFMNDLSVIIKFPLIIGMLVFLIFIVELFRNTRQPFINIALTLTAIIYIAIPFSLFTNLGFAFHSEKEEYYPYVSLGFLFLLWANDTGAYLVGRKFGKHRILERISPKKSWEGSIGGAVIAMITAFIISKYYTVLNLNDWLIISGIVIVAGTLGDFVESMLKRSLNIKDSGKFFPGHGGLLDRFDGLLIAAPAVFFYLYFLGKA